MNLLSVCLHESGLGRLTHSPLAVEVIRNNMAARQNDLRLYLDVIPDPNKVKVPSFLPLNLTDSFISPTPQLVVSWSSLNILILRSRRC